jgi:hypothetical protein
MKALNTIETSPSVTFASGVSIAAVGGWEISQRTDLPSAASVSWPDEDEEYIPVYTVTVGLKPSATRAKPACVGWIGLISEIT